MAAAGAVRSRSSAAAATAALRLANAGLSLIASVAISRALLPAGRGVYAVAATIAAIVVVAGGFALPRAFHHVWDRGADPRTLAGVAVLGGLSTAAVVALAAGAAVQLWPQLAAPATPGLVWLALAGVPAWVVTLHLTALLALHGLPERAAAAALAAGAVHTALLVAGAVTGLLTPAWVVASASLMMLLALPAHLRALPAAARLRGGAARATARLLRWALRYQPAVLANHLLSRADILVLAAMRDAREVGLYSLAVAVAEAILIVTLSIAQAGSGAQAVGDGDDRYTARLVRTSLTVAAVLAGGVAVTAHVGLPLLFGNAFRPSVGPLLVLLPGIVAWSAREPLDLAISRRDQPRAASWFSGAALGLNLLLAVALIPRWGATGAAFASTVAYVAHLALLTGWFLRVAGLPWRALRPRWSDLRGPLAALRPAGR